MGTPITKEAKIGFCNFLAIVFFILTVIMLIAQVYGLSIFFLFNSAVSVSVRAYIGEKKK